MKLVKPPLLALALAVLLAVTHQQTASVIADNRERFEQKLLRQMAGGAEVIKTGQGYDIASNGQVTGSIRQAESSSGYNGPIKLLVAYNLEGEVLSVRVTYHRDTPGLGDKIDYQVSDWIEGFKGRSHANTRWAIAPEGDIDAITGATITAEATMDAVREVLPQ